MKKIAIVNQRYGLEVNGGSEYYTRLIAERLADKYEVEVLTSCAVDYMTWANFYEEGVEEINGVRIRRFKSERERERKRFDGLTSRILQKQMRTSQLEKEWVEEQGPYCPALIDYIVEHECEYAVFIFVTYLYYFTAVGMPHVAEKSILIPTAHDEPFLQFDIYKNVFQCPKAYVFLTDEEQQLVCDRFKVENKFWRQAAVGIDIPEDINSERFRQKYGIEDPFMIYVGRIDEGKNCHWLFRYFEEYKKRNPQTNIKLVLMGKAVIQIPSCKDIVSLGFVSDQDKYDGIAACEFLVLPSELESLSISVLEAMELEKPVLVNGKCEVLKGHCRKSNGGFYYNNYFEFEGAVNYLLTHKRECKLMAANARNYVEQNYRWNVILNRLDEVICYVAEEEKL